MVNTRNTHGNIRLTLSLREDAFERLQRVPKAFGMPTRENASPCIHYFGSGFGQGSSYLVGHRRLRPVSYYIELGPVDSLKGGDRLEGGIGAGNIVLVDP